MELLVGDIFSNAARAVPGRVAAALDDTSLTFGELEDRANRTARVLSHHGIARGDRVAVWASTTIDVIPVFAAVAKLGAVFAPLNPGLGQEEARATIALARPALLVVDAGEEAVDGIPVVTLAALGDHAASQPAGPVGESAAAERDPHVVFFTSGSTGRPKGVVLSHRVNVLRSHPGALLEPRGAMVCPYPLFHMGAWTIALQQWQARDRVVLVSAADAGSIVTAVERHQATRLNCIPAVWRRLLGALGPGGLPSVRFADTGTSATPPELLEAIAAALPQAQIRIFYGSTEAGSVAMLEHADVRRKPGTCGVPGPSVSVRTSPDGELWVRSPVLFDGYFDDPGATAEALVDGWYRTGDLVDVDGDGYLTVTGRARDVLRTGGETVAPAEVEAVLAGHPAVADVAVVGLPDADWGELVCAVVVATGPVSLEDLRAHCVGRLASFKHPRRLAVMDAIPRTAATNQIQRRLLVERLTAAQESIDL